MVDDSELIGVPRESVLLFEKTKISTMNHENPIVIQDLNGGKDCIGGGFEVRFKKKAEVSRLLEF